MSVLLFGRLVLAAVALAAARRARGPRGMALAGSAGAAAAFGPGPLALPEPAVLAAWVLVATLVLALLGSGVQSPLASEAARSTAALAVPAALVAAVSFRGSGPGQALLGAGAVLAALSAWGAEGCRANAETGWRRALAWTSAVLLPPALAAGVVTLGPALPAHLGPVAPAAALLAALLAWLPPFLLERRRVARELSEEARLGIIPDEDLAVLGNPWRRLRETRFGRADERRAYVRSALLLAVARQQQRRRTGEANRLRQLEVIAFRTRVRRAVEGRLDRFGPAADESSV